MKLFCLLINRFNLSLNNNHHESLWVIWGGRKWERGGGQWRGAGVWWALWVHTVWRELNQGINQAFVSPKRLQLDSLGSLNIHVSFLHPQSLMCSKLQQWQQQQHCQPQWKLLTQVSLSQGDRNISFIKCHCQQLSDYETDSHLWAAFGCSEKKELPFNRKWYLYSPLCS